MICIVSIGCLFVCVVLYITTFSIFPGLLVNIHSENDELNKTKWMALILLVEFSIFEYLGRQYLTKANVNMNIQWKIMIEACVRIVFVPVFFCLYQRKILSDVMTHICVVLFAFSNGRCSCISFMCATTIVEQKEQRVCAAIMSSVLVTGICIGSHICLLMSKVV